MITQNEVLTKLQEYLAYSKKQKPEFEAEYTALISPLITAVETYFKTVPNGMISELEKYVHQAYCDVFNRQLEYEKAVPVDFPTDYPTGFDDVRLCFYQFSWVSTTPEEFFNAWVEEAPETGGTGVPTPPKPVSNTLIDAWLPEITSAPNEDLKRVKALNTWLDASFGQFNTVNLLEDQGKVLNVPTTQDIARMIYIDRHLLEVIEARGFKVYVPTYLR